jgi:hypothetical protein
MRGFGFGFEFGRIGKSGGSSYDPAATALFARMTVQPDNTRKSLINSLITTLKANGIWANFDALYVMAAHDAQAARLNWVQDLYNLTAVNSPVFTIDRGYAGDGSTAMLVTGITPAAAGLKFKQNSSHISCYDRTARAADGTAQIGALTGPIATYIQTRGTSDLLNSALNDGGSGAGIANAANPGFYAIDRVSSTSFRAYKSGAYLGPVTIASSAPTNGAQFTLLAVNSDGGTSAFTTDQLAAATIGAGLGTTMQPQLYTALQAYMTGVGANV